MRRESARGGEEKVSRATGRIDNRQRKQRIDRIDRVLGNGFGDNRFERAVEQLLHETVRCVVATCRLAHIALRFTARGKSELASVPGDLRNKLEEALINAT